MWPSSVNISLVYGYSSSRIIHCLFVSIRIRLPQVGSISHLSTNILVQESFTAYSFQSEHCYLWFIFFLSKLLSYWTNYYCYWRSFSDWFFCLFSSSILFDCRSFKPREMSCPIRIIFLTLLSFPFFYIVLIYSKYEAF